MKTDGRRTWVEIDTGSLTANWNSLSDAVGDKVAKMAVVKSNAYGHGMIECARTFASLGADFLGVDSFDEALELKDAGISTPLVVLGYTPAECFSKASELGIAITISSKESLADAHEFSAFLKVHIKADTGLHRQGFQESELPEVVKILKDSPHLAIEGLYTHLAAAETPKYLSYTKRQIASFAKWADAFEKEGIRPLKHVSASAAAMLHAEMRFDMVRFGISLYGLWPSAETEKKAKKIKLWPVLSWRAVIGEVKEVKKGEPIGYDLTERVKKNSTIAIVPVGYWHGFPRAASSKAFVLVKGKRAKVIGRVSMDMIAIDVSNVNKPKQGDTVTLIGEDGKDEVYAEELAKACGTINYEIVTRINQDIPRIYR